MRGLLLFAFCVLFGTLLPAQPSSPFFATLDAERGNVLAPARNGQVWVGCMKDEQVLLTLLSPAGKLLQKHLINFVGTGLDTESLIDLFEEADGSLVGCGNFENDNEGRGFVFRYNPATRSMLWAHIVRSGGLNFLNGITALGTGGDYVLYGNPHFAGGDDAELVRLRRSTGEVVPGSARRLHLGTSDQINQLVYHEGWLYACGRFTDGDLGLASFGKMRDMLCKIDTSTLQPVWTRLGPLPQGAEARLYGRDLVADSDGLVSTFSGDTTGSDLEETHFFIQKHDFDGNLLWMRSGSIVGSARPFVEDIVSTPDGYMLYGADFQSDTGRLFLIKTDKIGSPDRFLRFKHAPGEVNTTFGELPARSKALVQAENLYLSATSQDALGQTQALLIKTDLNGWVNDSCNLIRFNSGTTIDWITPANYAASPEMRPGQISTQAASTQTDIPGILLTRLCGAEGTCPDLPDLQVTLDSITCRDGNPLLYYTICNVGGQAYDGGLFLSVYDRNPLTDTAKLITFTIGNASDPIPPGECYPGIPFSSDIFLQNSFELDTFKRLYMLLGAGPNVSTPIPLSGFPYPPHAPECGYLNNLSEIEVPIHLCGTCDDPVTFAKKIGTPDQSEEAYSMCLSSDRQHLYLWGKQGASPIVTKLSTRGDIVWVRTLPVNANILIEPSEIFEDSDGKLALCGTFGGSPSNRQALALRYDPDADQVLWLRLYPLNRPIGANILEKNPGGNYILHGNYQQFVDGALKTRTQLMEIDRSTGEVVPQSTVQMLGEPHLSFSRMLSYEGKLYAAGTRNITGASGNVYPVLSKISASTLQPEWMLSIDPDPASTLPKIFGYTDADIRANFIIAAGQGQINPSGPTEGVFTVLSKFKTDGTLLWTRRYELPVWVEEVVADVNTYMIFGRVVGSNQFALLRTDADGNLVAARTFTAAPLPLSTVGYNARQNLLLRHSLQVIAADHIWNADGTSDILLMRTDTYFGLDAPCERFQSVQPAESALPAVSIAFAPPLSFLAASSSTLPVTFQPGSMAVSQLCPECVTCDSLPNLALRLKGVQCVPDSAGAVVEIEICNLGQAAGTGPIPLVFYGENPLQQAAPALWEVVLNSDIDTAACVTLRRTLPAHLSSIGTLHAVLGANAQTPTPFALADFPFSPDWRECDYADNLDSMSLALPVPPPLDLGPAQTACESETITLQAGAGFTHYTWQPGGASTPSLTVTQSGLYTVLATDSCGRVSKDSVSITLLPRKEATNTIVFYPGDTITIDGVAYTQSATVVQTFQTAAGCDSVVTTLLQLVITNLTLDCPPNLTVTLSPNQSSTAVDYSLPTGSTDCPDAALTLTLLQGPAIGDTFPEGTTLVCYQAANQCGIRDTCCFSVTAQEPSDPCDVQSPPGCLRFDLLDIRLDAQGQRRYRVRMTNTCTSSLQFAYIQLPNGVVAVAPKDAATYQAPSGNTYSVRNPNASPFYSMRFKPLSGTLSDGDAEVFEYTLPQQAQPAYIHVAARLLDGSYAQAHLSTYGCPVQPYAGMKPATAAQFFEGENSLHDMQVWPNPSSGTLTLDLRSWMGEHVNIQVLSLQGQALLQQAVPTESGQIFLHLPPTLPGGMYYLNVRGEASGERATARFVLER